RHHVPVENDRLIDVYGTDSGIASRFQPPGDSESLARLLKPSALARDTHDDRCFQVKDRIRPEAHQIGLVSAESVSRACLLKQCMRGALGHVKAHHDARDWRAGMT